ncbi:carbohydrate ABC transporter permease [Microlunatus flavus]|uniref:Raffinose/stachyose/melibiose transport system permease protein n=1 Tax=Microlunatus flavus TaxID=1036181 RepID=A0A1H8Z0U4_9ACTN|nr:sugar ABC transporter permease [Microlunatus flavus]SEP58065.1 raffinose/stachyose/melibiose transport system permease protein [Microlunatus flavus]
MSGTTAERQRLGAGAAGTEVGPGTRRRLRPAGYLWILPALVLCVGLIYYCIAYTAVISTWDWDGLDPFPEHVGAGNYVRIAQDPIFAKTIEHTAVFFVVTFVVQTALGVVFAVLLHSKVRLAVVYKVIIFIPVVLAPAITAPVFRRLYAPDGQFNWVLEHIGLGSLAQPWLGQESTALPVIMAITIWQWTGLTFVLYFAAMAQIDVSVLEAARIDGAGNLRVLASIIWPGVRGTTVALGILSAIGALKTFDVPYLVAVGGPNYATEFLGTYIYRKTIAQSHVGYGAALSVILLVLALGFAILLQVRSREKETTG